MNIDMRKLLVLLYAMTTQWGFGRKHLKARPELMNEIFELRDMELICELRVDTVEGMILTPAGEELAKDSLAEEEENLNSMLDAVIGLLEKPAG